MESTLHTDCLSSYDAAILALEDNPDDLGMKHKAVLSLARAGSLDLAREAYRHYGLDKVRSHEDIMSLGGRLSKDLYQVTSGAAALEHARDSAAKYEAAFKDSQGYYSGINSATMALMAGMPREIIKDRVVTILELLPHAENLTAQDHYFIEATRAECFLLLDETEKSKTALRSAIDFDPLNYEAHASTLKQFGLILAKMKKNANWLAPFYPPRPSHFAGHLWQKNPNNSEDLPQILSNLIQKNDIGFGYGALAAGADIIIAEALLSEGADLHVILPCDKKSFLKRSVTPYGKSWVSRFEACLEQARNLTYLTYRGNNAQRLQDVVSGQVAMGQAILRSQHLDVEPIQIIIGDQARRNSLTAMHKADWSKAGLQGLDVPVKLSAGAGSASVIQPEIAILLARSDRFEYKEYSDLEAAMVAISRITKRAELMLALDFDLPGGDDNLLSIMQLHLAGTVLVTEAFASYVALKYSEKYKVTFAGSVTNPAGLPLRIYTLISLK